MSSDMEGRMQDQIEGALSQNEQLGRDLMELEDVLRRNGFVRCDIPACNCGSWHGRYGIFERWSEIKDALQEADVLNNETGNLPLRAIQKLVQQRDDALAQIRTWETEEDIADAMVQSPVCTCDGGEAWKCLVHGDIGIQAGTRLDCRACDGEGVRTVIDPDERMAVSETCGTCGGRGSVGTRLPDQNHDGDMTRCDDCRGSGIANTPKYGLPAYYVGVVVNNNMPRTQVVLECPPNVTIPAGVTMIACPHPNVDGFDCCIWCGKNMLTKDFPWMPV